MASIKKPTYKVETKLATERKRRKSDLVLMWQSIMDVTAIVVRELWTSVIRLWEFLQIWFSSSERFLIQTWLEKYLPYVPEDFSESWRDGRLLAILLNKLQPGCFPDAYHLDPDYGLKNVYRVFDALEIYFGIKPNVSAEEIVTCNDGSDLKLFAILLELKNLTDGQPVNKEITPESIENVEPSVVNQSCIVKGTGLAVGFVGRTTNFIIFCVTIADLDVVVEIKGPNSICSERITKRSPRKRRSGFSFECARHLTRSASLTGNDNSLMEEEDTNFEKKIIPLEYEIIGNQISLGYKPREKGNHKVTILWHGQHVSDSPYIVTVEDPLEVIETKRVIPLKSAFKNVDVGEKNELRKISFQVQDSQMKRVKQERRTKSQERPAGKVISRKLIRYIVKINGRDIPVNADSTESLATELLKMDYDFETWPSFHRRNSWGFAGDAERKKSVIRQFGIDVKELDAQISQRRTRSLSVNPGSKKSLERSDSFDSLASKLNCLNEDVFENNGKDDENEDNYAYINEDIDTPGEMKEKKLGSPSVMEHDTDSEKNTIALLSELTGSKFDKSLEERSNDTAEADTISSLSINKTQPEKIDRSEDDRYPNVSSYSSSPKCTLISGDKADNMSMKNKTDNNLFNNSLEFNNNVKNLNVSSRSKIFCKCSKVNVCGKKIHNCSSKNSILAGKIGKFIVTSFYRKISKNKNPVSSMPVIIYRKRKVNIRRLLKADKRVFSKGFEDVHVNNMKESIKPNFKYEKKISDILSETISSNEKLNILPKFISKAKNYETENHIHAGNKELKTDSDVVSFYRYTPQQLQMSEECESSKRTVRELETTSAALKYKLKSVPDISTSTATKIKYENSILNHQHVPTPTSERHLIFHSSYDDRSSCLAQAREKTKPVHSRLFKPLRIHTLKTIDQFNFKQFNPSLNSGNAISPVKSQIEHWENTLSPEKECVPPMKLHDASDIEQVNVKEKLAFWECRTKASSLNSSPENNRKMYLMVNKKSSRSISEPLRNDDLQKRHCSESSSNIPVSTAKENNEISIDAKTNVTTTNQPEDEIPPDFQTNSGKIRSLSFSDPVVSETTTDKAENTASFPSSESSRKEYTGSSSDEYLEQYDSDETEDSGGDYLLHSTEDEYIDDEISERASEYWGDLSIVENLKMPNCPANEHSSWDEEFLQNYNQRDKSYPEECKVFGIAVYYGYVAVKNRFQVFTCDAGFGNLSVSMQGLRRHEVSLVSVAYMRSDIYEVTYQVMTAGYYLISIRWMDRDIPGSPFMCKVTF